MSLPDVAREHGVGSFAVKDEESRLGVPSFKLLGSSWALHELIRRRLRRPEGQLLTFEQLRDHLRASRATLCTASDGNYGRAVAALAEMLDCDAVVFLPAGTAPQRIADVRAHGARVEVFDGGYDATVARARAEAMARGHWYCPDTALFDGDASELQFARDVMAGYATLFIELVAQLGRAPDVVFVQAGVGGLAAGCAWALDVLARGARIVTVEPETSNAVQSSLAAGEPRAVADLFTMMAGLRSQSVSAAAWPVLRARVAAAVTITDADAATAMRRLAAADVVAGEAGAAGLAGAAVTLRDAEARGRLAIDPASAIVAVNTEGATDRESYDRILGR